MGFPDLFCSDCGALHDRMTAYCRVRVEPPADLLVCNSGRNSLVPVVNAAFQR